MCAYYPNLRVFGTVLTHNFSGSFYQSDRIVKTSHRFLDFQKHIEIRYLKSIDLLVLLSLSLVSGLVCAEPREELGLIDSIHSGASERLSDFVGQIDEFFGGEEESARVNQSWARLRLDPKYHEEDDMEVKGNLKLKVVLPNSERRFRLLFSTDDSEERRADASETQPTSEADSNLSFALRFIRKARENASVKFDLGVRSRESKTQTFVRLGAFHRSSLGEKWTGTITNNAFYYYSSGFEDKLTFKLERPLGKNKNWIFQSSSLFGWKKKQKGAVVDQVAGFYRAFGKTSSLAFELLSQIHTSPAPETKRFRGAVLQARYRRNVSRPWFYLEFWPSISWPVEHNYKGFYGALFRVEVLIGQHN